MYRYRRNRGGWGFPFMFPFIILLISHSFHAFIFSLLFFAMVTIIVKAVMSTTANGGAGRSWYQPPIYQRPTQQYYQPTYQPPVYQQPPVANYGEGYREVPREAQPEEAEKGYAPQPGYEQYEQPHAQYPQQLPPMQQQ